MGKVNADRISLADFKKATTKLAKLRGQTVVDCLDNAMYRIFDACPFDKHDLEYVETVKILGACISFKAELLGQEIDEVCSEIERQYRRQRGKEVLVSERN